MQTIDRRRGLKEFECEHGLYREIERLGSGEICGAEDAVGWVERSDTHQCRCVWRWVSLRSTHPTKKAAVSSAALSTSLRAQRSNPSIPARSYGLLRCARNDRDIVSRSRDVFLPEVCIFVRLLKDRGRREDGRALHLRSDEGDLPDMQSRPEFCCTSATSGSVNPLLIGFTTDNLRGLLKIVLALF